MPGFNTFRVDDNQIPRGLIEKSLDITATYGKTKIPDLKDVPVYTVDYEKEYGFKDLSSQSIASTMHHLSKQGNEANDNYITDKLGYEHSNP